MLSEEGGRIELRLGERVVGVAKNGTNIERIITATHREHPASAFIDTSYEGDLMVLGGVAYTWGRESPAQYGESYAGVRTQPEPLCPPVVQFHNPVPHTLSNGELLPLIAKRPGEPGQGDKTVQAYNYRLCLTQNRSNSLPIPFPSNASVFGRAETWELLRRWVNVRASAGHPVSLHEVLAIHPTVNGKADVNDAGPIGTDFLGASAP